ncbi:MAG: diaminopimelate decarboxylase [Actinomycetota bacterium]|nr:diaminopimelate decarboxylase [Actinomycetota bacterium]
MSRLPNYLLPENAAVSPTGSLSIGGAGFGDLVEEYGTPLFVYDEDHLRQRARDAVAAFPDGVAYATKAFMCGAMARLAVEEGMDLDVSTGGEIQVALSAGISPGKLIFHGNNKSSSELSMALDAGVKRIVVDSIPEIDRIESLVAAGAAAPRISIRLNPGIEAHTHEFLQTGAADSKFGITVDGGAAAGALDRVRRSAAMDLVGLHAHIGSQVFDVDSFRKAMGVFGEFLSTVDVEELSIGGGLGVAYVEGESAPSLSEWGTAVREAAHDSGITARIVAEPGRAIVAQAAVTFYTVGTIKEISGVRTYVSVDGGMSDNPRPVLYGSGYEVFLPRSTNADRNQAVRVVGKHCESGDVLVRNGRVPSDVEVGDVLATPVTGAYGHSMGSNYNMVLRPPVVFVSQGEPRLVVRRETYGDLLTRDLQLGTG